VLLPQSLDQLWTALEAAPDALPYAGGTDLLVRLRTVTPAPADLICLERIEDLQGVTDHGNDICIGACTTHSRLLSDPLITEHFPVLGKALKVLGSPPVRNMGTIGGNIVTASPAGDTLPPLYILGAELELQTRDGSRRIKVKDFILGPGATDIRPGEILTGVWLRKDPGLNLHHFEKVGQRKALAIALVSLAAVAEITEEGIVKRFRCAWGSVGPTVVTSPEAEAPLIGRPLSLEHLDKCALYAQKAVSPIDDLRASALYRRQVSGNLLLRLLAHGNDNLFPSPSGCPGHDCIP
jgi:xanthine dehydrogenase FAD-binding subunit